MGISKSNGGMGFRDLVSFNKALLAKQLWRLLQNPESLAAHILQAKYYPQSSMLETKLGAKPSYMLRSMMGAIEVLRQGLIWRVGDGSDIKVLGDRWLPLPIIFSVQSLRTLLDADARVTDLIDKDTK